MTAATAARARADDRAPLVAARLAALGTIAFATVGVIYLLSAQTARGQEIENALFDARREELYRGPSTAIEILATVSVWSLVAAIAAVMAVALARGRPRLALGAGAVIGVSIVTTEVLKLVVLPRPRLDPDAPPWHLANVFPSGHTTIGMATAVAFLLVVPYRWRGPAAVSGAVYAAALAASTLEAGWHRTSDALGAIFLVAGLALWACAALVAWRGVGHPHDRGRTWAYVPLAAASAVGALVLVVGGPRTVRMIDRGPLDGVSVREGYAVTVTLVVLAVVVVMVVLLLALRDVSLDAPPRKARGPRSCDRGETISRPTASGSPLRSFVTRKNVTKRSARCAEPHSSPVPAGASDGPSPPPSPPTAGTSWSTPATATSSMPPAPRSTPPGPATSSP